MVNGQATGQLERSRGLSTWAPPPGSPPGGSHAVATTYVGAMAMAKGADGDYFVRDPTADLNGLQARLEAVA